MRCANADVWIWPGRSASSPHINRGQRRSAPLNATTLRVGPRIGCRRSESEDAVPPIG